MSVRLDAYKCGSKVTLQVYFYISFFFQLIHRYLKELDFDKD
jgi:hypothetical protein